jgi:hypothetical protein
VLVALFMAGDRSIKISVRTGDASSNRGLLLKILTTKQFNLYLLIWPSLAASQAKYSQVVKAVGRC